jgi:hypothetical protein
MTRLWNALIFVAATIYFAVDGLFSFVAHPITVWVSKKKLLRRARLWITSLGPYPSLVLFAVPLIILEPAKPLSAYLIGTGHFFAGAVIFIAAEVLKLTVVERLFHLNKKKLLSIPAFAWAYGCWSKMMDVIQALEVWKVSRRIVAEASKALRTKWHHSRKLRVEAARDAG